MRSNGSWWAVGIAALALGWGVARAQTPPPATPQVHHSACALAESMANSLRKGKAWQMEHAQNACRTLLPTMDKAQADEFLRCCLQRLTEVPAAPARTPSGERSQGT